jgi:hypothetical protein
MQPYGSRRDEPTFLQEIAKQSHSVIRQPPHAGCYNLLDTSHAFHLHARVIETGSAAHIVDMLGA